MRQRIAIIGSGISGLSAAYLLHADHDVKVYEASDRIGGHTATVDIEYDDCTYSMDTGFLIYNDHTYPHLTRLFSRLGVKKYPVSMVFSVFDKQLGIEYSEDGFWGYFSQRKNLFSLEHWKLLREILTFNKLVAQQYAADSIDPNHTVISFAKAQGFSEHMIGLYLIPVTSAIWSVDREFVEKMPLQFFAQFFVNHGLLHTDATLQWYTIKGCARSYLDPLTSEFASSIHVNCPIQGVQREGDVVRLFFADGGSDTYDQVIFATHSDDALQLLRDATDAERDILGAMEYQRTDVVVHHDDSILPEHKRTWGDWNCGIGPLGKQMSIYYANQLHGFTAPVNFWVTVNPSVAISPEKILYRNSFRHPVFSHESVAAQERREEISGHKRTWFVGAYWGRGFHEDGLVSAMHVAKHLGSTHEFLQKQSGFSRQSQPLLDSSSLLY